MSTRAPLISTISHVFSRSLYANAKSPSLRKKLEKLLVWIPNDADGETDCEELALEAQSMSDKTRFEAGSASVWRLLQHHVRPRASHRLKPSVAQPAQLEKYAYDDHLIFTATQEQHHGDEFMLDDEKYCVWYDEENLFDIIGEFELNEEEEDFESDDDLFRDEGLNDLVRSQTLEEGEASRMQRDRFDHDILEALEFLPTEEDLFAEEDLFQSKYTAVLAEEEDMLF